MDKLELLRNGQPVPSIFQPQKSDNIMEHRYSAYKTVIFVQISFSAFKAELSKSNQWPQFHYMQSNRSCKDTLNFELKQPRMVWCTKGTRRNIKQFQ